MILKVVKENNSLPVDREFALNPQTGMYESMERHDDIREDYEVINQSHFAFSPSFYEANKELFNQVKLEEENEKNKNIESEEASKDEAENLSSKNESSTGSNSVETNETKEVLGETMEEGSEESKGEWRSVPEGRPSIDGEAVKEQTSKTSDSRIDKYHELRNLLIEWNKTNLEIIEESDRLFREWFNDLKPFNLSKKYMWKSML